MTKTCSACGQTKPETDFQKHWNSQRQKHYRMGICRPCRAIRRKAHQSPESRQLAAVKKAVRYADPVQRRIILSQQHRSRYGITLDEKDAMLAAQGGVCAVCGTDDPRGHGWCTDHDHACCPGIKSCGECLRGVLCTRCNFALGQLDDNPAVLQAAIDYLLAGLTSRGQPNLQASVSRRVPA